MQPRGSSRPTTHRTEHYCGVHVFVKGPVALMSIPRAPNGAHRDLGRRTIGPAAPTPAQPTLKVRAQKRVGQGRDSRSHGARI